ncbi:MAG: hypothetical protein KDJ97_15185 [Anaerolineae bacterium]|nr:hypothetical protein [Anaerolineae bacterium]
MEPELCQKAMETLTEVTGGIEIMNEVCGKTAWGPTDWFIIAVFSITLLTLICVFVYSYFKNILTKIPMDQIIAIILILPFIFVLVLLNKIGEDAATALYGTVIGYIFGRLPWSQNGEKNQLIQPKYKQINFDG